MNRRAMLGGVGAAGAALKACHPVPAHAAADPDVDAELIAACRAYPGLLAAANDSTDPDMDGPKWVALDAAEANIRGVKPQTLQGLRAKAEAARAKGVLNYVRDVADPTEGRAEIASLWTWEVVEDLLRLGGAQ